MPCRYSDPGVELFLHRVLSSMDLEYHQRRKEIMGATEAGGSGLHVPKASVKQDWSQ